MNALAYSFHRIGRCIASGGRRMERLMLRQRAVLKRPDIEGRMTKRGAFKETIKALRMRGLPSEQGYETGRRIRYEEGTIKFPHTKSLRRDRRAAKLAADKAHRAALRAVRPANGSEAHLSGGQLPAGKPGSV